MDYLEYIRVLGWYGDQPLPRIHPGIGLERGPALSDHNPNQLQPQLTTTPTNYNPN
ncbi:MAG: hypothetical protein WBI14_02300 [Anaerolineaceae bacterium]